MSFINDIRSIERVTLAEAVRLPAVSSGPISLSALESGKKFTLAQDVYKDTLAKFYFNIITPMVDKGAVYNNQVHSPTINQRGGTKLRTSGYKSSNYIELVIPKYILLNFKNVIPAGTEFLVGLIGGSTDVEDLRIIGVYTTTITEKEIR